MAGHGSLIINPGSSSVKYRLYQGNSIILDKEIQRVRDFRKAAEEIVKEVSSFSIDVIAYRVVHGGSIRKHCIISKKVMHEIEKAVPLAPEHMPQTILIIKTIMKHMHAKHIACLDTAFYTTIPRYAYEYAIPKNIAKKDHIRKYGFHGLAHEYMLHEAMKKIKRNSLNLITCQLGNGVSITAIRHNKAIDTSMGFTPLEGIMMGTRSGSIDPAIIEYLCRKEKKSVSEITRMLEKDSGFKGLTGKSDVRDVLAMAKKGNKNARLALSMFSYEVEKQIGAYAAILGKVDAVVFGGGIARNKSILAPILKTIKAKKIIVDDDEQAIMHHITQRF